MNVNKSLLLKNISTINLFPELCGEKEPKQKKCVVCGAEINDHRARYCSDKCRSTTLYVSEKFTASCKYCGTKYSAGHGSSQYCSIECKRRSKGAYKKCDYCHKEYFAKDIGRKYCSTNCDKYGRSYGTKEQYEALLVKIRLLLEKGLPTKKVASDLCIPYTAVKRVIDDEYLGMNPCHQKAINLFVSGKTEQQIADIIGIGAGSIITWLTRLHDGYTPPLKKHHKSADGIKEKRDKTAKYLRAFKRLRSIKLVANELGVTDEKALSVLRKNKFYKKYRDTQRKASGWDKARFTRSRKYDNEAAFERSIFEQILKLDPQAKQQVYYLDQKTCDIVCTVGAEKYAIELKTELKEPKFSSCSMQAVVAGMYLNATSIYCHPDDCWPTQTAMKVIDRVFGNKVKVLNEKELMEMLNGKAKKICQNHTGAGRHIGIYEGAYQQAVCAA